jgi:multiple sugar transport system ATP-binding protein
MAEVQLIGVQKRFGNTEALRGINLTIPQSTYACLLGPSGCGKSTLLRTVAGLETPDSGEILLAGERVEKLEPFARNVGLAFQNYALYPHLNVRDNLTFPLRAPRRKAEFTETEIEQSVKSMASLLHIDLLLNKPIGALSGGQKQRVALGRALIRNPTVLLLDEPITHLDARLRHEMRVELKLLQRRLGTTTIHVTHDQLEALALSDLMVIMRNGLVEQTGSPDDICTKPATSFVASFVGDPPMSLLRVHLDQQDGQARMRVGDLRLPSDERLSRLLEKIHDLEVVIALPAGDIALGLPGDKRNILATVHAHEWVGRELQIGIALNGSIIRLRTQEHLALRIGDKLPVRLDLKKAHLFNPKTGFNLER